MTQFLRVYSSTNIQIEGGRCVHWADDTGKPKCGTTVMIFDFCEPVTIVKGTNIALYIDCKHCINKILKLFDHGTTQA